MKAKVGSRWFTFEQNQQTGKWDCLIPEETGWECGDWLLITLRGGKVSFENLCEARMRKSRFSRDWRSLQKRLRDPRHPLRRILIVNKEAASYCALPKGEIMEFNIRMPAKRNCWLMRVEAS